MPLRTRSSRQATPLQNSLILSSYYLVDAALIFVVTLLLARYLGVDNFGKLAFATSYGLLFSALSDFGINLVITKFVARERDPNSSWLANTISIRLMSAVVVTAIGLAPMLFSKYLAANAFLIVPIFLSEQLRALTVAWCAIFRGFQKMVLEVLAVGTERLTLFASVLLLLRSPHGTAVVGWIYFGARLLALLVAIVIFDVYFARLRLTIFPRNVRALISEAAPLAVLVFSERVNLYFSPFALALIAGEYAAGLFQAAFKIATVPVLLCAVVGASLYPAMSAAFEDHNHVQRLYRLGIRALWHVLLPAAVVTTMFAPQVVRLFFGTKYAGSAPLLRWLTPYYLLCALVTISYYLMPALNKQKVAMTLSFLSILLNITVSLPLMLHWGAKGAAVGLVTATGLIALGYVIYAGRLGFNVLRLREDFVQIAGFIVAIIIGVLLRLTIQINNWSHLLLISIILLAGYSATLLTTRSLLAEEAELLAGLRTKLWR